MRCNLKINKKIVGLIIIGVVSLVFLIIGYYLSKPKEIKSESDVFVSNTVVEEKETVTVYINGEVNSPGVYDLKSGSRVKDVLKLAKGFTKKADKESINLAKKIKDEQQIYVDKVEDDSSNIKNNSKHKKNSKININKATKEELKTIPGIGDVTAEKIINYREEKEPFNSIEDIKNIDRIGEKTFEKIKDKIDVM